MSEYSQYVGAQMDPLSMQEIIAAPLYKQKLYDALEADRVATQEAFKVDPLDVHKEKAQQLQNDFNAKADELARYQLKTGDLQGAKTKMLQLRQEYKRLMDPMGDVSKINSANKAFQDEKTRFLEGASKQYGSTRALELWNQHANTYKGYDDKGNVRNIDSRGIVANQDFMKDVKEFHDLMGKTTSSIAGSGYKIVERSEGLVMVNSSGKTVTNNNFDQLKNAENALKSKWINPTGEGTLYNIEAGKNPQEFENYFKNTMYSQRESGINKDSDTSASFIGDKTSKSKETIGEFEKIPYGIENTSVSTDIADKINSIGGKSVGKALSYSYDVLTGKKPQAQSQGEFNKARSQVFIKPEDVLQGGELSIYNNAKKQVSNSVPGFNKLSVTEQNKLIANKASKDILTFSPIVIKPTIKSVGALIPGVQKGADIKSIGNSMLDDAIGGARVLYDVETGEPLSKDDVKETVKGMSLYGVTAPHNLRNQKMIGATINQKVSPIIATITTADGKRQVYVSRTGTELKSPEFAKIKSANDVFNGVVNNMNTQVRITDKNSNMYGSKVKYDSSITDGYPIIMTLPNGVIERISLDEFQNDAL